MSVFSSLFGVIYFHKCVITTLTLGDKIKTGLLRLHKLKIKILTFLVRTLSHCFTFEGRLVVLAANHAIELADNQNTVYFL